jgi:hypothetical protein
MSLFNFSNLSSIALVERYKVIIKGGKKLIKYLELMKWEILNNLQNRYSPAIGRMKTPMRRMAFALNFERKNKDIKRITETIVRGA